MIRRQLLDDAVLAAVLGHTGKPGDNSVIPADPGVTYFIMYPLDSPGGEEDWGDPEGYRDFKYQFTSVGVDARQANWLADRIQMGLTNRDPGGNYSNGIAVAQMHVNDRWIDSVGAARQDAREIWSRVDRYNLRVQKT